MGRRKYICPKCSKRAGANILYGMPAWDQIKEDVEAGDLIVGGCLKNADSPERECTSCGHQWRIKRRKPRYSEELDPVPDLFVFQIGGFAGAGYRVEWRDGVLAYSKGFSVYHHPSDYLRLDKLDWRRFGGDLMAGGVYIWDWKGCYDNPAVLDGTQWELELHQGQYKKRIFGSNAYPGSDGLGWEESQEFCTLITALGVLVGDAHFAKEF